MNGNHSADLDIASDADAERVPLRWLLDQRRLGLVVHHLPTHELTLDWAHAIELDDPSPWLRGQGLVLTTGLRIPRTRQGQGEYVARLAGAGASALGFGTGLRYAAIPFGIAAACREHGLALVEVPLPTPFLAVVQAVNDRLGEQRRLRLRESLAAQQELTRAALRGGVPALVRSLARILGASTVALAGDGTTLGTVGSPPLEPGTVLTEVAADPARAVHVAQPGHDLEIQPLGAGLAEPLGWLALSRVTPLRSAERVVLHHAASIATLELARHDGGAPAPGAGLESAVVAAIAAGATLATADALRAQGLDPERPVALVALAADQPALLDRAVTGVRRARPLLAGHWPEPDDVPTRRLLVVAADDVEGLLAAVPAGVTAAMGPAVPLGHLAATLPAVARCLSEALTDPAGAHRHVAESPVAQVLAGQPVAEATAPWLRTLEEYDAAHDAALVDSLAAYLHHHGVWDPAAKALGIHRHTLRHRMDRVEELTGIRLADPGQRALLTLALQP